MNVLLIVEMFRVFKAYKYKKINSWCEREFSASLQGVWILKFGGLL